MSEKANTVSKRALLLKISIGAVVLLVVGFALLRGVDFKGTIDRVLAWVRGVGPVTFFTLMAILPAFGVPLLAFSLTAGPVFAPEYGLAAVTGMVLGAVAVNLALTYWLARYAFRPVLARCIKWMGYNPPVVAAEDRLSLAIVARVTPGPPYFVQCYLLGMAEVPFLTYMAVSLVVTGSYSAGVVLFGDSVMQGKGKVAFFAVSLLIVATVIIQWIRRRYSRAATAAQ